MAKNKQHKKAANPAKMDLTPIPEIIAKPSQVNAASADKFAHKRRYILTAFALATVSAFLFSMKPIFVKLAYDYGVDSTTLMTLRMVFSLPFFIIFGIIALGQRRRSGLETDLSKKTVLLTSVTGILGYYIASWCDLEGLSYITAQFERLILFSFPMLVALLNFVIFKQNLSRHVIFPMALSYVGLAIIFTHDLNSFGADVVIGASLVGAAALSFAFYLVFSKPLITKTGSRIFTSLAMSAASAMIILHFIILKDTSTLMQQPAEVYYAAVAIAILSTVIPAFLVNEAISRLGAQKTSIVGTIGPVFTTIVAVIVLDESFTPYHAIGMGLVIIGVYLLSTKKEA